MPETTPIYYDNKVFYAVIPVKGYTKFEVEITYRDGSNLDPLTVYVLGGVDQLNQLLERWNRGENFKYRMKP